VFLRCCLCTRSLAVGARKRPPGPLSISSVFEFWLLALARALEAATHSKVGVVVLEVAVGSNRPDHHLRRCESLGKQSEKEREPRGLRTCETARPAKPVDSETGKLT